MVELTDDIDFFQLGAGPKRCVARRLRPLGRSRHLTEDMPP
jgi:hypothetical protein